DRGDEVGGDAGRRLSRLEGGGVLDPAAASRGDARGAEEAVVERVRLARVEPELEPVEALHPRVDEDARHLLAVEAGGGQAVDQVAPAARVVGGGQAGREERPAEERDEGQSAGRGHRAMFNLPGRENQDGLAESSAGSSAAEGEFFRCRYTPRR